VNRLLAEHIELAGPGEAGVAVGSQIMTVQALRIEEINDLIRRRVGSAAGVRTVAVGGDLDHVRVDIGAAQPGAVMGHSGAAADRLRAELEELTGKPVQLNILHEPGLPACPAITPGPDDCSRPGVPP
jgi:ribosomal protein S3